MTKYKDYIGKKVEIRFLDHEKEDSVENRNCLTEKSLEVILFGKFIGETKDYIVIAPWVCEDGNDIYRILKCAIIHIKILK